MNSLTTSRFALPLLAAGQADKELTHNEALTRIDMLLHPVVQAVGLSVPPTTPGVGQCWVVGVNRPARGRARPIDWQAGARGDGASSTRARP